MERPKKKKLPEPEAPQVGGKKKKKDPKQARLVFCPHVIVPGKFMKKCIAFVDLLGTISATNGKVSGVWLTSGSVSGVYDKWES